MKTKKTTPNPPDEVETEVTARPKEPGGSRDAAMDADLVSETMDYGRMSLEDARESGYTAPDGRAMERAKPGPPGRPTGAYTDVGAGRASAVVKKSSKNPPKEAE